MNCSRCNTPIDEHEASPCMNMWVDAVVFDWHHGSGEVYLDRESDAWRTVDGNLRLRTSDRPGPLPKYSTDIAAAFSILEEKAFRFDVGTDSMLYLCRFRTGLTNSVIASAPTVPLAICRAALKAYQEKT